MGGAAASLARCGEMPSKPKRPRAATTDEDYRASMLRMVNSYANRIVAAGVTALADAVAVRQALDSVIDAGVEACRSEAWSASWPEVAAATGLSRSAAAERWANSTEPQGPRTAGHPAMTFRPDQSHWTWRYYRDRDMAYGRRWWISQDPELAAEQLAECTGGRRRARKWVAEVARRTGTEGSA